MGIWTRKKIDEFRVDSSLKRVLTANELILLGIGTIIGAGIFTITGIAAAKFAGPAIVLSFFIAALGCLFASFCYSELSAMIPVSGSAYTYAYAAFGEIFAWIIGWDLILEYAIGAAAVSVSWSGYFVDLLNDFGISWPKTEIDYPAFLIVIFTSFVLITGIKQSSLFNSFLVFLKLLVIAVFIGIGLFFVNPENLKPFIPENTGTFGEFGFSGILKASGIIFFAYIGFDAISTTAQEVKNPEKDLKIGIIGSLLICTVIYLIFSFILTGIVNYRELDVSAPVALAIDKMGMPFLSIPIKLAILAGLTSVILVFLLGQSRILYTMAHDGLMPKIFKEIHPKFHTPWKSNIILMFFVGTISSLVPLSTLSMLTSTGTLFAFVLVCVGVIVLRYREPKAIRPFKVPFYPITPLLGTLVCLVMIASLGILNWIRLFSWLVMGLMVYFLQGLARPQSKADGH